MKEKELFNDVINVDEEIQNVFKPVKAPYLIRYALFLFVLIIPIIVLTILTVVIHIGFLYADLMLVVSFIIYFVTFVMKICNYKNTYYCVTNKRLIIRNGVFGIDFKSVDLKDVEAMDVYVGFFDKCFGKNSGTIVIATYGRPFVNGTASFAFVNVGNAYTLCANLKTKVEIAKTEERAKNIEDKVVEENVEKNLSTEEKILKLKKLRQQGIIDEAVYEETIKKIIDKL